MKRHLMFYNSVPKNSMNPEQYLTRVEKCAPNLNYTLAIAIIYDLAYLGMSLMLI
jgi:hypothetical protein